MYCRGKSCIVETNCPVRLSEDSMEWVNRVSTLEPSNACAIVTEITVREEEDGVVKIMGKVKPFGPFAGALQEKLDDAVVPTFVIRGFTVNTPNGEQITREIRAIIGFDLSGNGLSDL